MTTDFDRQFFAPGRINLIGEHIDYSGGHVFPCAITYGTTLWIKKRDDKTLRFFSKNFEEQGTIEVSLDSIEYDKADDWANYPKGVFRMLLDRGYHFDYGLDLVYEGNIPNGAGLSSSASIEVVTGAMLNEVYSLGLSMVDIALISQKAENEFVGVNCGIMDQFAVAMGKEDNAILLNTNTLEYEYIPVVLEDASIVIMNTNKRRGLADSQYNLRRAQCEKALELLQQEKNINYLCDLSVDELESLKHLITDEEMYRRAYHAVSENERTLKASKVLQENDLVAFGKLMNESHVSLRDDYEVTGIELDTLVEAAWNHPGTIGARVTGAGFGGCAIAIVENDHLNHFIEVVSQKYEKTIGYPADFYVASVGKGAHEVK
ncbi:MAG TPA: galactokinase [Erysipelothrix sp.]|nr:galactokinase [Erysipelothrix sp.]